MNDIVERVRCEAYGCNEELSNMLHEAADTIEKLRAALTICADQFDQYAEHHKVKMETTQSQQEYVTSSEKWNRNQLLAFNAREAME